MLLADSFVTVVGGLLVLGTIGFVVLSVALVVKILQFVFRRLAGLPAGRSGTLLTRDGRPVCTQSRCGHLNPVGAQFCARCGRPLSRDRDLDAYG